jgi:hypothetical protein
MLTWGVKNPKLDADHSLHLAPILVISGVIFEFPHTPTCRAKAQLYICLAKSCIPLSIGAPFHHGIARPRVAEGDGLEI